MRATKRPVHPRSCGLFLFLTCCAVPVAEAQVDQKILEQLEAGELKDAVLRLRRGVRIDSAEARIAIATKLVELATRKGADEKYGPLALQVTLDLLRDGVPKEQRAARADLVFRAVKARVLPAMRERPEPGSKEDKNILADLRFARGVLVSSDAHKDERSIEIGKLLFPYLRREEDWIELRSLTEGLLENPKLGEKDREEVRELLGLAQIGLGRTREGLPLLEKRIARSPRDPVLIGSIASALYRKEPEAAFSYLLPVLAGTPEPHEHNAYRGALETFYRIVERLPRRKAPMVAFWNEHLIDLKVPPSWPNRTWNPGYRLWRPDNQYSSKQYSGDHAIQIALPESHGWKKVRVPDELRRWNNVATCLRKGSRGPTVVLYWYGPDVHYWYGHTPESRGLTGKSARGHSKGAIASLVKEIVYGVAAKRQGHHYRSARPLGFKTRVRGTRFAYRRGDVHYDETIFSLGQVTGELLVRIRESDLELLEPEIEWLFRNLRTF